MYKCNICGMESNLPLPIQHGIFKVDSINNFKSLPCMGNFIIEIETNNNEKDSICL